VFRGEERACKVTHLVDRRMHAALVLVRAPRLPPPRALQLVLAHHHHGVPERAVRLPQPQPARASREFTEQDRILDLITRRRVGRCAMPPHGAFPDKLDNERKPARRKAPDAAPLEPPLTARAPSPPPFPVRTGHVSSLPPN